jgi:hypothetical protein
MSEASDVGGRPIVLFLGAHNAGRSLAARVLLEQYAAGRVEVVDDIDRRVRGLLARRAHRAGHTMMEPI